MPTTTYTTGDLVHAMMRQAWDATHNTTPAAGRTGRGATDADAAALTPDEYEELQSGDPRHRAPYTADETEAAYHEAERRRRHAAAAAQAQAAAEREQAEQLADAWSASLQRTADGAPLRLAERRASRARRWAETGRAAETRNAQTELRRHRDHWDQRTPEAAAATQPTLEATLAAQLALTNPLRERRQPYHAHPPGTPCPPQGC